MNSYDFLAGCYDEFTTDVGFNVLAMVVLGGQGTLVGPILGAAVAHNFGFASSATGIGPNGMLGALGGLAVCLIIGFFNCKRGA